MSSFEPIPERTQVHVDRLLGAQVGEWRVLERLVEGRLGTLYRGAHVASSKAVTLEVLRAGVVSNEGEVSAANAIKVPGVVTVIGSGSVSDGRTFRVMEPLDGASLDRQRLPPREALQVLDLVATVLEAAHAWSVVHGQLGPSSVFVTKSAAKLIDFGLARRKVTTQDDLRALGALGFSLLTGEELREGAAPPPMSAAIPEPVDRLLRELMEERIPSAGAARRELAQLGLEIDQPARVVAPVKRRSRAGIFIALGLLLVGLITALSLSPEGGEGRGEGKHLQRVVGPSSTSSDRPVQLAEELTVEEEAELIDEPEEPKPTPKSVKATRPVPTAEQLSALIRKLEAQLRAQKPRYGDDVEAALFVLNKQRLRLAGSPSVADRKDVAKQLAGWRRSYLRSR